MLFEYFIVGLFKYRRGTSSIRCTPFFDSQSVHPLGERVWVLFRVLLLFFFFFVPRALANLDTHMTDYLEHWSLFHSLCFASLCVARNYFLFTTEETSSK